MVPTEIAWHPSAISRRNRERYVAVQSNLDDGYVYRIVVLKDGRIVETGKHDDLLKKGVLYSELWEAQEKAQDWECAV